MRFSPRCAVQLTWSLSCAELSEMLGVVVFLQLSFIAGSLSARTGLRFSKDPTAYAVFKGWNAKTNGNLTFHFKTDNRDGFLVYEDDKGQCQYIYLSLADGRLRLRLKMGDCEETQTLLVGHNLTDGKWHKVIVQRNYKSTTITVDSWTNITEYKGGGRQTLGVQSDLFVGGIPWSKPFNDLSFPAIKYESIHLNGFHGCVSGIMHSNGVRPLREAQLQNTSGTTEGCLDPCSQTDKCENGGICRDSVSSVWCDCNGTRFEGANCTEETSSIWLNGSGYVVFHVIRAEENLYSNYSYVAFHLKTENSGGIIFSLQSPYRNDYLLIEMTDGKIRVELDLGEGQLVLAGKGVKVNDDKWHWVEFSRWRREVALKIDHRTRAGGEMPGKSSQLNVGLEHKVYLAGGPRNVFRKSESKQNFSGYLQEFYFRHMKVFDSIVPSITDRRFVKVGTVIDGAIILDGSASGCFPAGDDEDEDCRSTAAATPPGMTRGGPSRPRVDFSKEGVMTSATHLSTDPGPIPTGVQAQRSLPQVVPFWIISVLVVIAAIAILVTIFFLYRWNSRYSGSFKPESASSSCGDSPKHSVQTIAKPRIYVSAYDEKV